MDTKDNGDCYRTSGKVAWLRLLLLVPFLLAACAAVAWGLSWAFVRGWYYLIVTPAVAGLLVGMATRWVVAFGRCRNKRVAGVLGGLAGLIAFVGYYHVHMIAVLGPAAMTDLGELPAFIRFRMATDGLFGARAHAPNVIVNWLAGGADLVVVMALAASLSVARAGRVYCESCQSWMRRVMVHTAPGSARAVEEALAINSLDRIPDPGLFQVKIGQPMAMLDLEYCPRGTATGLTCPSYLTLRESYKGANGKPRIDTLIKQRCLAGEELRVLAEKFPHFRRAPGALAPLATAVITRPGETPAAFASREEVNPGSPYPLDSRWRNAWMILLSLAPLFALAGGLALVGLAWWNVGDQPEAMRLALGAAGVLLALTGGVITWHNVDGLSNRYVFRFTCQALGARPDAWVAADDPQAVYVAVIPRKNWGPLLSVTDRGFLLVDQARRCLLFEGIQERYRIPASAIRSCEIEAVISGGSIYGVVLRCLRKEAGLTDEWEIPLSVASRGWSKNRASIRLARATELHERIEGLRSSASA